MDELGKAIYIYQLGEVFDIMARLSGRCKNSPYVLAPFVPANPVVVDEIFEYLKPEYGSMIWDLGSGDGRVLAKALQDHGMRGVGVEWDKNLVENSRELIDVLDAKEKIEIREGKIQDHITNDPDFADADIVFVYLLTHSNVKLAETLQRRLKKGARVVAYAFPFRGWEDTCTEAVEGNCQKVEYYIYTMPGT
jgi:precorrin-6B methylase 2